MSGTHEVAGSSPAGSTPQADGKVALGAHEFREKLGYWMERAAAGDEILITRRGRRYARLGPRGSAARHHRYRSGFRASSGPGGASIPVLLVLRAECLQPGGPVGDVHDLHPPQHLHPGQLIPVVRVAIDRQRRPRIPPDEPQPRRLALTLRLLIDRAPDPSLGRRERHRQDPWRPIGIQQPEPADPLGLQQFVCPCNYLGRLKVSHRPKLVDERSRNGSRYRTAEHSAWDDRRPAHRLGACRGGRRFLDPRSYRSHRLPELRAAGCSLGRRRSHRPHQARHRRPARSAAHEPRSRRQAVPLPRRPRGGRTRRPRHRPRRARR